MTQRDALPDGLSGNVEGCGDALQTETDCPVVSRRGNTTVFSQSVCVCVYVCVCVCVCVCV